MPDLGKLNFTVFGLFLWNYTKEWGNIVDVLLECVTMTCNTQSCIKSMVIKGESRDFGKGGALCWPPWLAGEENFRFQMV